MVNLELSPSMVLIRKHQKNRLEAFMERGEAVGTGENDLLIATLAGNRAGFGTFRGPVFGRKGHTPEGWARRCKLQTDLGLAAAHRPEECHSALLFLFRLVVPHVHHASAGETSAKQNQGSVGIDRQSFGVFLEVLAGSVLSAYAHRNLHQHALTAAPRSGV